MGNRYLDQLRLHMEERYSVDAASMTNSAWICANTTLRKRPFGFVGYEFQRAIADDMHPDLTVGKCSQVGLTEVQLRKALTLLRRNQGLGLIFTLPNEDMYKRVAQTRLLPLVEEDKVFNPPADKKPTRSMSTIQVVDSFMYLLNCTEAAATGTPADILIHDELDISPMDKIGLFQSRLQRSKWKITQRFSTPTFLDFGVDAHYKVSDQREYFAKCGACGFQQVPTFDPRFVRIPGLGDVPDLAVIDDRMAEKLDLDAAFVGCERCGRPLDLADAANREWVAAYPTRTLKRGYRVRPFSIGDISVRYVVQQLLEYKRANYIRGWYNTTLGEPYAGSDVQLTVAELVQAMRGEQVPEVGRDVPVAVGIDIGQTCHLVLGTPSGSEGFDAFLFATVPEHRLLETVAELRARYTIVAGAADRMPYTPTANALRDQSHGVIMPVQYRGEHKVVLLRDEEGGHSHFSANRTKMVDDVVGGIRSGRVTMRGYGDQRQVVINHLRDMVRDEAPEKKAEWKKLTGQDHYFHAMAFLNFAMRLPYLKDVISGDEIRTSVDFTGASMLQEDGGLFAMQRPGRSRARPADKPLLGGLR